MDKVQGEDVRSCKLFNEVGVGAGCEEVRSEGFSDLLFTSISLSAYLLGVEGDVHHVLAIQLLSKRIIKHLVNPFKTLSQDAMATHCHPAIGLQ